MTTFVFPVTVLPSYPPPQFWFIRKYPFRCFNEESAHKIDEDVHDSSKVSDDSCRGEEETVGHDLQVELDAHTDHKHILPDLEQEAAAPSAMVSSHICSLLYSATDPPVFTCSMGTCMILVKGDSNIMEMQEQMVTTIITQSR